MDQAEQMYRLMRSESNRLKTFQMNPPWPKDYVDIKKLAKAGFFYAFNGDNVHCAFCRGQVCRWDRADDPMTEHAKHFTTCPFIMGGEVGNEPLGEDPFPGPKRPRPYDVCGHYQNFPAEDPRSPQPQPHELEPNNDIDREHHHSGSINSIRQYIDQYSSNHELGEEHQNPSSTPSRYEDQNQNRNFMQPNQGSPTRDSYASYEEPLSDSHARGSPSTASNTSNCSNSSSNLTGICKICYTNSIELVFLPCGHSVSCLSCARRIHSCPFCRANITTRIRTFLV